MASVGAADQSFPSRAQHLYQAEQRVTRVTAPMQRALHQLKTRQRFADFNLHSMLRTWGNGKLNKIIHNISTNAHGAVRKKLLDIVRYTYYCTTLYSTVSVRYIAKCIYTCRAQTLRIKFPCAIQS
jgi:hypothetical protein